MLNLLQSEMTTFILDWRRSKMVYIPMNMTTKELRKCLIEDMEMLRDGRWEPDDDSIDAHIYLIEKLFREK